MNIDKITDDWLMILVAMIRDCGHMVKCPNVNIKRKAYGLPLRQARKMRGLKKISVFDAMANQTNNIFSSARKPPQPLPNGFLLSDMPNEEVRIWHAIGAEIMDYSCLGLGVRPYIESVWLESEKELNRRKIEPEFFCDLKMEPI